MKCGDYGGYERFVVMVCCVGWSLQLVLYGVEACLRVREDRNLFTAFIFV